MKLKNLIIAVIMTVFGIGTMTADDQNTSDLNVTNESGDTLWYVGQDFDGLYFQLPNGLKITKGSEFTALSPDGSFGINMVKINQPSTRKISVDLCKRAADSFHIPRSGVKKVSFSGVKGARAEGIIEGKKVTIVVLPFDEHQVQIVLMSDSNREDWVKHFLSTLKR